MEGIYVALPIMAALAPQSRCSSRQASYGEKFKRLWVTFTKSGFKFFIFQGANGFKGHMSIAQNLKTGFGGLKNIPI
jgi:hypothetical protein